MFYYVSSDYFLFHFVLFFSLYLLRFGSKINAPNGKRKRKALLRLQPVASLQLQQVLACVIPPLQLLLLITLMTLLITTIAAAPKVLTLVATALASAILMILILIGCWTIMKMSILTLSLISFEIYILFFFYD